MKIFKLKIFLENENNRFITLFFQLIIGFLFISIYNFKIDLNTSEIMLLLTYSECLLLSFLGRKLNIFQLLLFTFLFFNLTVPFFHLLGIYEYPSGNNIMASNGIHFSVNENDLIETYKALSITLLGTSVGWLSVYKNKNLVNNYKKNVSKNYGIWDQRLINIIFWIFYCIFFLYEIVLFYFSRKFGYISVIHLNNIPLFLKIIGLSVYFFKVIAFIKLYFCITKKEYIKYSSIIMLPFIIQMFTGARGESICLLIALLFIYNKYYEEVKIVKTSVYGFSLLIIAEFVGKFRYGLSFAINFDNKFLVDSIISYSESVGVIAYTIALKNNFFNKVPFLFGYIQAIFSFAPNYTVEGLNNKSYLAQHLIYLLNPTKFFHGSTIGTSIVAEFYEFARGNLIIIFILGVLMLSMSTKVVNKLFKGPISYFVGISYLIYYFESPRGSVMKIFNKEIIIEIIILIIIREIFKKSKNPRRN